MGEGVRGFLRRNKKRVIVAVIIYVLLTLFLMIESGGDLLPFDYQIF